MGGVPSTGRCHRRRPRPHPVPPSPPRLPACHQQEIAQKAEVGAQRAKEVSAHRKEVVSERVAAAREARTLRNRGVLRQHERLARAAHKEKEGDLAARMEALKVRGCAACG